jgi:hypothetical protein
MIRVVAIHGCTEGLLVSGCSTPRVIFHVITAGPAAGMVSGVMSWSSVHVTHCYSTTATTHECTSATITKKQQSQVGMCGHLPAKQPA